MGNVTERKESIRILFWLKCYHYLYNLTLEFAYTNAYNFEAVEILEADKMLDNKD